MKAFIFTFWFLTLALLINANEGFANLDSESNRNCPEFCRVCISETYCIMCFNDYFLYYGTCLKCNNNCKTIYSDYCKCYDCYDGYYFYRYQCLKCDSNCKTCSDSANTCTSCEAGYYLDSGCCLACPEKCKECTNSNTCESSKLKSYL